MLAMYEIRWREEIKDWKVQRSSKALKPKWNFCVGGMGSCGATPSALMEETGEDARLVGSGEGIP